MVRKAFLTPFLLLAFLFCLTRAHGQDTTSVQCMFDDGKQMSVRYHSAPATQKLRDGRVWSPGNAPIFLFTSAALKVAGTTVPVGAYSIYVIPEKKTWTLIVNKNVAEKSEYDPRQDLARAPMETGALSQPSKRVTIFLGHIGPKQCNMRLYYGTIGAFGEFLEQ